MKKILVLVCLLLFLGSFISAEYAAAERFVNNKDGTVTDTQTGLMWADHDNGSDINWSDAQIYCNGYSGGGKSGWRMPTIGELEALYISGAYGSVIKKTSPLVWSSETYRSEAFFFCFYFDRGFKSGYPQSAFVHRALPVRSGK